MEGDSIHIRIIGMEVIRNKFDDTADKMIEILKRFKSFIQEFCDNVLIEIIDSNKTTTIE